MSPVSPSELMIALHNIDCRGDDNLMKAVIRGEWTPVISDIIISKTSY